MTRPFLAALASIAALTAAAPGQAQQVPPEERGRMEEGVWVPEGNTLAEVREQQAANRAMAEFARNQVAENEARLAAFERAQEEYRAEVARLERERVAAEAEAARVAVAHEAEMARWREAVAKCGAGEVSYCAQPAAEAGDD